MGLNASAFFKGYGFMENVQDKAYQRERQEKQDAIEAEKMARTRKDWEYQDKHNADIDQELVNARSFVGQGYAPVADKLGLNAPDSVAGLRDWSRRDALPREDMGPVAPAAVAQTGLAPQKFTSDQANNLAALNLAGRNPKAIFDVRQAHTNSILASQANELKDRVLKADDEQLKELVGKWTLDKRQKFEVDYDPKTGLSRVAHGKDAVELNRSDLANFVAARYRQSQGDPTAGAEIDAIDGKLTKMVQDSLTQSKVLADSGNDAFLKANTVRTQGITAGAAATTARAHAGYYGAMTDKIGEESRIKSLSAEAIKPFVERYNKLSPEEREKQGPGLFQEASIAAAASSKDVNGLLTALRPRGASSNSAKFEADNVWAAAETKLMESNTAPADISIQKEQFYARRGFAPQAAVQVLLSGRDPTTHDALTEKDVDDFNAHFPNTPIPKTQLPWLTINPTSTKNTAPPEQQGATLGLKLRPAIGPGGRLVDTTSMRDTLRGGVSSVLSHIAN